MVFITAGQIILSRVKIFNILLNPINYFAK